MSNNHYYTPIELQDLYAHFISILDFSTENLTTDKECTIKFSPSSDSESGKKHVIEYDLCEKHEREFIKKVLLNIKQDNFENKYNSHDWLKIYKHVFQHAELINSHNMGAIKAWHFFSLYFREAFRNELICPADYNLQLKHFISMLIFHGGELEAKCIHQFLQLALKIQSNIFTSIDSQKVANMLGGVFYTALKIEGRNAPFKLLDLQEIQQVLYVQNLKKMSSVLRFIIEDSFFENDFNKKLYSDFLIIGKTIENMPALSSRIESATNDERLPDESFIKKFKLNLSTDEMEDNKLPLNKMANLNISRKRISSPERSSQEDTHVKVSFSDDVLIKRSKVISEGDYKNVNSEKKDKSNTDLRKKYMAVSRSLGDKLEKKCKDDFDLIQNYNIFNFSDGEKTRKLEKKASKKNVSSSARSILDTERKNMSTSKETTFSSDIERRKMCSDKDTSPSSDIERRKIRSSKETSLSPDIERRKVRMDKDNRSKERSLSPDSEKRKTRLSKLTRSSPETEKGKLFSSKERSPSPEIERRDLFSSKTLNLEDEKRQDLVFSNGASGTNTLLEINKRIVSEEKDKTQVDRVFFK